jgi:hypothetical protein
MLAEPDQALAEPDQAPDEHQALEEHQAPGEPGRRRPSARRSEP